MSDGRERQIKEAFDQQVRVEQQRSGWLTVVFAIGALVVAIIGLTVAYAKLQSHDDSRFSQFQAQLKDATSERDRLNREIDALKSALDKNNVPIPPEAVDTGPTTTTVRPRTSQPTTSRSNASGTTPTTPTTTAPSRQQSPPPSSTTTTTSPPRSPPTTSPPPTTPPPTTCRVPVTNPVTGQCPL